MQPVLLQLGPLTFYSFGIFAAVAFAVGGYVTLQLARREKLSLQHFVDYCLYVAVAVLVGARLWYVLFRPDEIHSFWQLFTVGGGGLALPGGLLAGTIVLVLALRHNREPVWRWLDVAAIGTAAGLAVGKLGSLLNGDGFGTPSGLPWAVKFTDPLAPATVVGQPLHPLQIYAAILYAGLAFGLWRLHQRLAAADDPRHPAGTTFWAGLLGVSVIQLALEPWHSALDALTFGDPGGLRVIVPTAIVLILLSLAMLYRPRFRRPS